jgi:hypothetical protein
VKLLEKWNAQWYRLFPVSDCLRPIDLELMTVIGPALMLLEICRRPWGGRQGSFGHI